MCLRTRSSPPQNQGSSQSPTYSPANNKCASASCSSVLCATTCLAMAVLCLHSNNLGNDGNGGNTNNNK